MLTPCLGRERVHLQLDDALSSARWVSVVGPPGSGKTLLVRHLAARCEPSTWVNAQGLRTSEAILAACLDGMKVEAAPGDSTRGALSRALDGTDTLLVVDGVDVDADGLGPALQELVETTTGARLALTARTMAGQPGERVVRVGPLPVPGAHEPLAGAAVDLFLARIEAAGGYPVDLAEHGPDVRRLLTATGGLPLLIEQLAVQIALVGLTNVAPTASLTEAVHVSYELLDEEQRRCFRRLAQMTVPVSIDVLADIVGVPRDHAAGLAAGLARRSLIEVRPDGRLDMLTPIRRHGTILAGSTDDAAQAAQGLIRWADRVAPVDLNYGAADAPWLADLKVMRAAITAAVADPATRDLGYGLANRVFSSLYTAMRAREAVEILEEVIVSGDGPAAIGAQVARRAGIAASEVRGTYEGLWLLERSDQHAEAAPDPALEMSRNAAIRAEMHLDAGVLADAEAEARRAIELDPTGLVEAAAMRTVVDVQVSRGEFPEAAESAQRIHSLSSVNVERFVPLSVRTLMARIALEQGRSVEAASAARGTLREATQLAEDRMALLTEVVLRQIEPDTPVTSVDRESLPWAVRLPVLAQDARDHFLAGDFARAAGLAADVVVLADSCRLGRDAVDGRLTLAHALLAQDEPEQAATTFLYALEQAAAMPMPLRVADAFDGLALAADRRGSNRQARQLAAAARAMRAPRHAVPWGYAALKRVDPARAVPDGWIEDGQATSAAIEAAVAVFADHHEEAATPLDALTKAERQVAERVADGKTSREIAGELFLSPRTVDAHLSHIYRKLDISSRAKLAAMVADLRS